MTENEIKAIKWLKNMRDDAVVTLEHIQKNEPNVSPMLYAGRKEKAEIILEMCEELEQHRAIGTVEEHKDLKEKNTEKRFNIFESHGMRQFVCGCCDRPILITDNYCSFCGQKIDWQRKER